MLYFAIILSGGVGALLRYFVGRTAANLHLTGLPLGTLIANVVGCFLMGYLSWALVHKFDVSKEVQAIVLTGFLGGFTTFSAFSLEVITLLEQGADGRAILYVLLSLILCVTMCFCGLMLARQA